MTLRASIARLALPLLVGAVCVLGGGCTDNAANHSVSRDQTPTLGTSNTPLDGESHPVHDRTGIAEVDDIVSAIDSDQSAALQRFVHFTGTPCVASSQDARRPACEPGVNEGTSVDGFVETIAARCGGVGATTYRRDQVDVLARTLRQYVLYAVYADDGQSGRSLHAVFARSAPAQPYAVVGMQLTIVRGAVTAIAQQCGTLAELIAGVQPTMFVLPPRTLPGCSDAAPIILCTSE